MTTEPSLTSDQAPSPAIRSPTHVLGRIAPRILRATDPSPLAWPTLLGRATTLGFDTLLLPSDTVPPALVEAANGLGIALLADIKVDQAESGEPIFQYLPRPSMDPRGPAVPAVFAMATIATLDDATSLAAWWAPKINALYEHGLAGVRLLGLDGLPGWAVPSFLTQLRSACPDVLLFAWTPVLSTTVLQSIPPQTIDLVATAMASWDGNQDGLWTELQSLRRIAPTIAEAGPHPTELGLAAIIAEGWMATVDHPGAEALNHQRSTALAGLPYARLASPAGAGVVAILRTDVPDPRQAKRAVLAVTATAAAPPLPATLLLQAASGDFAAFIPALDPATLLDPAPGSLTLYTAHARAKAETPALSRKRAELAASRPRIAIESPSPCVENGRFPARQIVGTEVTVEADIIADGHDHLAAAVRWRAPGSEEWQEAPMTLVVNDRWSARFPLHHMGIHHYTVEAWKDVYDTYVDELEKKHRAGIPIALELQEGAHLVQAALDRAKKPVRAVLAEIVRSLSSADAAAQLHLLLAPETRQAMARADDRPHRVTTEPLPVQAERSGAAFASWYEVFPRSMSGDPDRHGTFRDVAWHLPRIEAMGFDVLYFPPIHPIGRKNRKGANNTLTPSETDPGSPYAIGSEDGGHEAIHPELGSIEDFQHLRTEAANHGIELAIDFAIQCSPDHPWLQQHKDWFMWRPDGTIRYAENPPKKYEDIVNVDFYAPGAVPELWMALANAVLFWAEQGVRLFRVDNPHTKPLPFWEWMIAEVQQRYPDSVFLAEAFTRPKVMYRLAKVGFSQSYTYFTWRNSKQEFLDYLTELADGPPRHFFRPHFFVNTPDINPIPLQTAPRSGFLTRAALAATLSGLWGVYNGFELCEAKPVPGREEYLDSEKYQIRVWDWDRPGNIVAEIAVLNTIRRRNPALQTHLGVTFLNAGNDQVLLFEKATPDRSNVVLVAINMDLFNPQSSQIELPVWRWTPQPAVLDVTDLVHNTHERWTGRERTVSLTSAQPYAIWRITPAEGLI